MRVPAEISQLAELCKSNIERYSAPAFSEAAIRHQFIGPFFIALGWAVNNTQGFETQPRGPYGGRAPPADRDDEPARRRRTR